MKILFVDADDCLNCWETTDVIREPDGTPSWIPDRTPPVAWKGLDEFRLEFIRNIVKKTKCKIVLSTSWRTDEIATAYFIKRLGEETSSQIIGSTPDFNADKPRADEIEHWLSQNTDVTKFVVLDNSENDDLERFGRSFVQPTTNVGMTEDHMKKVIEILGEE